VCCNGFHTKFEGESTLWPGKSQNIFGQHRKLQFARNQITICYVQQITTFKSFQFEINFIPATDTSNIHPASSIQYPVISISKRRRLGNWEKSESKEHLLWQQAATNLLNRTQHPQTVEVSKKWSWENPITKMNLCTSQKQQTNNVAGRKMQAEAGWKTRYG